MVSLEQAEWEVGGDGKRGYSGRGRRAKFSGPLWPQPGTPLQLLRTHQGRNGERVEIEEAETQLDLRLKTVSR